MIEPKNSLIKSFRFAFKGIGQLLKERNFKIHILMTFLVILMGFYLEVANLEWVALMFCISLVLVAEGFNTAIELMCNRITREHDPLIGKIKDLSAAAVLITAIISALIGMIIFLPKMI